MKKIKFIGLYILLMLVLAVVPAHAAVNNPASAAAVTEKTYTDGLHKINGKYYYFLKDGSRFNKGLLKYEKNGKTVYSYFLSDGSAYTKGYKTVTGGYVINKDGKAVAMKNKTKTHYYFRTNGMAFTGGYLKFTHKDGKIYYRYFGKDGKVFNGGYKIAYGRYEGADGVIKAPDDKSAIRLYFLPDGHRYTGGLLVFTGTDGKKYTYYFKSNGEAFTKGYKKVSGGAVIEKKGDFPVPIKDKTVHYYYFKSKGNAFNKGFLRFVHTDGKTYNMYFTKSGTALTSKKLNITKRYSADEKGNIKNITNDNTYGYSFASNGKGKLLKNSWNKMYDVWTYYNGYGVRKFRSDNMHKAWTRIRNLSSYTSYYVVVDTDACETYTFTGSAGNWKPRFLWKCSPGKPSTPTVKGFYNVTGKGYFFNTSENTCYYSTQFYGDYLFHTITFKRGTWEPDDARLGMQLSHGCVRLSVENAKWFYDNLPIATRVYIY